MIAVIQYVGTIKSKISPFSFNQLFQGEDLSGWNVTAQRNKVVPTGI